jgi:hypothetical protein
MNRLQIWIEYRKNNPLLRFAYFFRLDGTHLSLAISKNANFAAI